MIRDLRFSLTRRILRAGAAVQKLSARPLSRSRPGRSLSVPVSILARRHPVGQTLTLVGTAHWCDRDPAFQRGRSSRLGG